MLKNVIDKVLVPDMKGALAALKKGVLTYGVKKVESVVSITTAQLPDFAKVPAKAAVMDIVKKQAAALTATEMGEGEDVGFDPAKLILGEGIKLVGGVVPPLIKK